MSNSFALNCFVFCFRILRSNRLFFKSKYFLSLAEISDNVLLKLEHCLFLSLFNLWRHLYCCQFLPGEKSWSSTMRPESSSFSDSDELGFSFWIDDCWHCVENRVDALSFVCCNREELGADWRRNLSLIRGILGLGCWSLDDEVIDICSKRCINSADFVFFVTVRSFGKTGIHGDEFSRRHNLKWSLDGSKLIR